VSLPLKEGKSWAIAAALSLPAFVGAIYNPDLFWHLSAGRFILAHGAVPRADWLSFTKGGTPWLDFEWLAQIVFELAYRAGGFFALWLIKGAGLFGIWFFLDKALALNGLSSRSRAAGLMLWGVPALMNADIRPELFSLVFFSLILWLLEGVRLGRRSIGAREAVLAAGLFALWDDLHLGFLVALAVAALYLAAALAQGDLRAARAFGTLLIAGFLGTFANPYGAGPYEVAWQHWRQGTVLSRYIAEWRPMSARNPVYWSFWVLLPLCAAAVARVRKTRAWAPSGASVGLGVETLLHQRMVPFFAALAVFVICLAAEKEGVWGRRLLRAGIALCALLGIWLAPGVIHGSFFNDQFVPRVAAEFLDRERDVFAPLRVYNPWEWGGYLGWRLAPWHKVYDDGRYIFHEQLPREAAAVADVRAWAKHLADERIDAVLLQNLPTAFPTTKVYPDGSRRSFDRPYYLFYAPQSDWALVHWDDNALVFVRRAAAPPAWLKEHEYRYLRPRDRAALAEALERKEVPRDVLDAEASRHLRENASLSRGL